MNTRPAWRGPGTGWLPRAMRQPGYAQLVGRFALLGPVIGGLPYAWVVVTLPFVYAIGLAPALLAGMLYAGWWFGADRRRPTWAWRATIGALCGAAGSAATALAWNAADPSVALGVLALHGVPAAVALALWPVPAAAPAVGLQGAMANTR